MHTIMHLVLILYRDTNQGQAFIFWVQGITEHLHLLCVEIVAIGEEAHRVPPRPLKVPLALRPCMVPLSHCGRSRSTVDMVRQGCPGTVVVDGFSVEGTMG
jgi:hypothetical protein